MTLALHGKSKSRQWLLVAFALLAVFGAMATALASRTAQAEHVEPVWADGNPTCGARGFLFGFKPFAGDVGGLEADPSGAFGVNGGTITVTENVDDNGIDWTSTFPILAVIVKGSSAANVYYYTPDGALADTGLITPNNSSGSPAGLSHVVFCWNGPVDPPQAEIAVRKTATGSYTRTYEWDITKTVTPTTIDMFKGDSHDVEWTVEVKKTTTDSDFIVSGQITIENNGTAAGTVSGLTDSLPTAVITNCKNEALQTVDPVGGSVVLAVDDSITCDYTANLGDTLPASGTNVATVTSDGDKFTGPAGYNFAADPTIVGDNEVTVDDTNSAGPQAAPTAIDKTWTYSSEFACTEVDGEYADEGEHKNTATIKETGKSAGATVKVNCNELVVTKTANTSYDRTCDWDITKTSATDKLTLKPGEVADVEYTVTVSLVAPCENSAIKVKGEIKVHNPALIPATIKSVSDLLPGYTVTVVCEEDDENVTFPYTLAAGKDLVCTYSADVADLTPLTNTGTATLQNFDYDKDGNAAEPDPENTTDFSSDAVDVTFGGPTGKYNVCIVVRDDNGTPGDTTDDTVFGGVCEKDAPKTFTYKLKISAVGKACEDFTFTNTASFKAHDAGDDAGSDDHVVKVTVLCEVNICKFYDADTQGDWDAGEVPLKGWLITINGAPYYTGDDGCVTATVAKGAYTATEGLPSTSWKVTTGGVSQNLNTDTTVKYSFGNVCLGAGGGHTLGYWSNKNGQAKMNDGPEGVAPELALLSGLNLRTATGANFDPATYTAFRTWLLGANATNMAYMLSAQLAAMQLNVEAGIVSGGSLVWDGSGFISITNLMAAANTSLGLYPNTVASGANRAAQEALKNALDKANNNLNFVQTTPCAYSFVN